MTPEYKYIELVFENCSVVRIEPKDVLFMSLDDVSEDFWVNMSGQLVRLKSCKRFSITLRNEAIEIRTSLEKDYDAVESFKKHIHVFQDITGVVIRTLSDEDIYIHVPYEEESPTALGSPNKLYSLILEEKDQPFTLPSFTININSQ